MEKGIQDHIFFFLKYLKLPVLQLRLPYMEDFLQMVHSGEGGGNSIYVVDKSQ